jgi:hypothetical protein
MTGDLPDIERLRLEFAEAIAYRLANGPPMSQWDLSAARSLAVILGLEPIAMRIQQELCA